jgi:hypothetical protein
VDIDFSQFKPRGRKVRYPSTWFRRIVPGSICSEGGFTACASASQLHVVAPWIVLSFMSTGAPERNAVLALAAMANFSWVHVLSNLRNLFP